MIVISDFVNDLKFFRRQFLFDIFVESVTPHQFSMQAYRWNMEHNGNKSLTKFSIRNSVELDELRVDGRMDVWCMKSMSTDIGVKYWIDGLVENSSVEYWKLTSYFIQDSSTSNSAQLVRIENIFWYHAYFFHESSLKFHMRLFLANAVFFHYTYRNRT